MIAPPKKRKIYLRYWTRSKCQWCHKDFMVFKNLIRIGKGKFCSKKCVGLSQRRQVNRTCLYCGKEFEVHAYKIKENRGHFCSKACMTASNVPGRADVRKKISSTLIAADYRGAKSSHWRGGVTSENHIIRGSTSSREWRKAVFERDAYKCGLCGKVGHRLNVHHILPFNKCPERRFEVSNGMTLCQKCHKQLHRGLKFWCGVFAPRVDLRTV
jgi:5-methylcytosine-specific restriction endonuclease McrA